MKERKDLKKNETEIFVINRVGKNVAGTVVCLCDSLMMEMERVMKKCPKCGKNTFKKTVTGRQCTQCGQIMEDLPLGSERGQKCSNCGKFTVFGNKCRNCGVVYY